ncbi:glycerophosphodiester phosphodiesterase [Polyangium sorediatum]|uniref:Glycerophosphodiester phosphodiesterase n=1 Tax=Polyangium sorediatum TaxID=889274 RepID=A0ABT6NKG5_9BACT|nr:glycerophosphodiester phosphodiesterase [Polyangium sorediatum]MDI1428801.1 glycerophosphodiester phosphodiesterase [Polyangium sorediatum]
MSAKVQHPVFAPKTKPLVFGHRGTPLLHQENSMAGFRRAAAMGIAGVEFDVFLTRDERVVVFHDADTERLTGVKGRIQEMTWDEITKLRLQKRVAMGKNARGEEIVIDFPTEEPIPLLEEVLAEVSGRLLLDIELKPEVPSFSERHVGAHVAEIVRRAGAEARVVVTSFDFWKLGAVEKAYAALHTGIAYDDNFLDGIEPFLRSLPELHAEIGRASGNQNPEMLIHALMEANPVGWSFHSTVVNAEHTLIDSDTVKRFHDRAMAVGAYTMFPLDTSSVKHPLPEPEEIERIRTLVAYGVDWFETDDPEKLQALLG